MLKRVFVFILVFFSLFLIGVSNNAKAYSQDNSLKKEGTIESSRNESSLDIIKVDSKLSTLIDGNNSKDSTTINTYQEVKSNAIIISKAMDDINVGDCDVLNALIIDKKITNHTIIWTSSDNSIATVDDNGKVSAISTGTVTITAATIDGENSTSCNVTVPDPIDNVTSVSLNVEQDNLTVGQTDTLIATVTPDNATNRNVIWESSDSDVATVDDMGNITGVNIGTAIITAVTEEGLFTATCVVDVSENLLIPPQKAPVIFAIDMGHNTKYDKGAVGIRSEDACTKEVGTKVIEKLTALGYTVIDCTPTNATSTNNSLKQRVDKANAAHADYYLSIHFNIFNKIAKGSEVYMGSSKIKTKAQAVLNNLKNLGYASRGLHDNSRGLYVLKNTKMPAMLVECSFLDSVEDMARYNADDIAQALVEGLITDN